MCGFCGLIHPHGLSPPEKSLLQAMTRTIIHRGPDDEGFYLDEQTGLGARRLSIIDLEHGHQPLSNEDGSIWIAYNGEVYNFPELKKELQAKGHKFKTRTDTETIVHAYEEWGENFIQRLRGMFAFALWDKAKKTLYLWRDRVGIKPLYYSLQSDGTLLFGSELKTILVYPQLSRSINPRALDLYLTLEYIPAPYSIFKDIYKLPPGYFLKYHKGEITINSYWDLPCPSKKSQTTLKAKSLDKLMEELYSLIKESVSLRLISDVPLGAFLSGGIDSSTIVGLMRELGVSPLMTFSIGFEDSTYNELQYARQIARKFETHHEELILRPDAVELVDRLIHHLDEPFGDFSLFPTFLVSKMARERVKVILSGDGGDEVFGGYEHYQAQKIAGWPFVSCGGRLVSRILQTLPPSPKKKGLWNKLRRFTQGLNHPISLRHLRWMVFLGEEVKKELYSPQFYNQLEGNLDLTKITPFTELFLKSNYYDPITAELFLDFKIYLPDDILVKVDRMSMATSLETRVPLLDHRLVEFVFSLPGEFKLKGLTTKWIFKKTMERLLPQENIYRPKEGFSIPIKHWLRHELKNLMLEYLDPARLKKEGYFNPEVVDSIIRLHLEGRENFSHQLWSLLVFQIWKENYL
ncbi:asparagine synthase (glutamine-hydrolyzing) [Candidatus Aminicenantes bacterium AC-334-K16]|jgi:asparagine synthase (glutamine-hydrolysing)|nr:asparagine synthase (glutamine-hydrolyzing) [Candidatus Aminicenantes bacterium AC-334-K16]